MAADRSNLETSLSMDAPLVMPANYQFSDNDRRFIDNQIQAIQKHLTDELVRGIIGTWFRVDGASAALVVGDVVATASSAEAVPPVVTKWTSSAQAPAGVVLAAASPGGLVRVATMGMLPASVTGLATAAAGLVRASSTGRAEKVTALDPTDAVLGYVDAAGNLSLAMVPKGIGGAGVAGTLTTTDVIAGVAATIAIPDATNIAIEVYATAKKAGNNTKAFFAYRQLFYRHSGGSPTAWGTSPVDLGTDAGGTVWTATFAPVSNTVEVRLTGQASTTVKWNYQVKTLVTTDG